ncbi:MAG TPA: hypothetical protein VFU81_08025 [Thermomicrobiales bacterium]|nr:hypothetical protein [Thermomicrobiales bacterium]
MVERHIDTLTRSQAAGVLRRQILAGLVSGLPAALLGGRRDAAAACKRVGKKCKKNKDCCNGAKCKGGNCKCKAGRAACGGTCVRLDADERHCGGCGVACGAGETCCSSVCADVEADNGDCGSCGHACAETEECVAGICGPPANACPVDAAFCSLEGPVYQCGGDGAACSCMPTTESAILCGDLTTEGTLCGQCQSSADCVDQGFGADAFCAKSSADCCGPDADNICLRRCPA